MRAFLKGFKYAFSGIIYCIKNERNMRFHTVAMLYVLVFARFFDFSRSDYILLLLTISAVISAEAFNTAIEKLCDKVSSEYHPEIKASKDAAAGAVLIAAIFAAVIGIILFWNIDGWLRVYNFFIAHPAQLCLLILFTVLAPVYIFIGPVGIKKLFCKKPTGKDKENDKD